MLIFSKVRLGVTPDVNALAAIAIALVGIGVAVAGWILRRREAPKRLEMAGPPGR
jgi:putrescine transport system permease protein